MRKHTEGAVVCCVHLSPGDARNAKRLNDLRGDSAIRRSNGQDIR